MVNKIYDVGARIKALVGEKIIEGMLNQLSCERTPHYARIDDNKIYIKDIKGGELKSSSDDLRLKIVE